MNADQPVNLRLGFTEEGLRERMKEVLEGVETLSDQAKELYKLTRDGKPTPEQFRDELMLSDITGDEMFEAIRLGIQAWAPTLLAKER